MDPALDARSNTNKLLQNEDRDAAMYAAFYLVRYKHLSPRLFTFIQTIH
ncbi:hypothetical protein [Legionella tunisiensis]|nr:hypothetical protein [Legionella tunisiensis]